MTIRFSPQTAALFLLSVIGTCSLPALAQQPPSNPPPAVAPPAGSDDPNDTSAARSTGNYVLNNQVDWIALLPPPPQSNSSEQQRDIQAVLDMQSRYPKGSAREQQAVDDSDATCFRFDDVLGERFKEKKLEKTAEFLKKAASDSSSASSVVKNYWKRTRPYINSDKIIRLGDMDPVYRKQKEDERKAKEEEKRRKKADKSPPQGDQANAAPPPAKPMSPEEQKKAEEKKQKDIDNTSYPSGHSTFGTMCAILLAQMVPEKQAELFARAETYRESRMILGAHYRTDIEAGRTLATAVAAVMSQSYGFQHDLAEARAELRKRLELPVEMPKRKNEEKRSQKDEDKTDQDSDD
jgi:acid phosphatase (class A)